MDAIDREWLADAPAFAQAEPERPARREPIMIANPALMVAQTMGKLGEAGPRRKNGKGAFVDLPCFTC